VHLIGEGDSEIAALREVLEHGYGLTFETLGIAVIDMGGADIPAKAERLLGAFRGYVNYFLIVFDNEGTARELIDALVRSKVIEGVSDERRAAILGQTAAAAKQIDDADARREALQVARERSSELQQEPGEAPEFVLWRESFEADNFSIEEMLSVLHAYAEEVEIEKLRLSLEDVELALHEKESGSADPKPSHPRCSSSRRTRTSASASQSPSSHASLRASRSSAPSTRVRDDRSWTWPSTLSSSLGPIVGLLVNCESVRLRLHRLRRCFVGV
jgi:hypothetical protein